MPRRNFSRRILNSELEDMNFEEEITEDTLFPLLRTTRLGRTIHAFSVCDSTSLFARRLLERREPPPHGTLVVADYQRAGYGRHARPWQAPAGTALLFSLILYPEECASVSAGRATMAAGAAVIDALRAEGPAKCAIKWPNDILAPDGRKLCGILTEQTRVVQQADEHVSRESPARSEDGDRPVATRANAPRRHALITGIGINVNQSEEDFPEPLRGSATSVRLAVGRPISRLRLLAAVLKALEHYLAQPDEALFDAWQHACTTLGRTVRVRLADRVMVGQALGLESDGSLILRHASGTLETIHSGDVEELRVEP